jgi:hypothetical protein
MSSLTTGIDFPLQIFRGNLKVSSDADLFKGHILSWLQTELKERVMRLEYGLADPLFNTIADIGLISNSIREGLTKYVPQVSVDVLGTINDNGEAEFQVRWIYKEQESSLLVVI